VTKKVVEGGVRMAKKKATFAPAERPLSRWSTWTMYDEDLENFLKSDDKYWNINVPEGMDAEKLRSGLRSRIKAKFKDKIKLASKSTDDGLKMQLQKK
jgi:hypothetical protein